MSLVTAISRAFGENTTDKQSPVNIPPVGIPAVTGQPPTPSNTATPQASPVASKTTTDSVTKFIKELREPLPTRWHMELPKSWEPALLRQDFSELSQLDCDDLLKFLKWMKANHGAFAVHGIDQATRPVYVHYHAAGPAGVGGNVCIAYIVDVGNAKNKG